MKLAKLTRDFLRGIFREVVGLHVEQESVKRLDAKTKSCLAVELPQANTLLHQEAPGMGKKEKASVTLP